YARAYLQFLTAAAGEAGAIGAEAFAFATRLTRLTRALHSRNPERAIQRAAAAAPDWSSGTRIGDALKAFNDRHGRRGMARGAVAERAARPGQLGGDAERLWPEPRQDDTGMVARVMTEKTCIYPGCERPAAPPHPLGGPQPSFCELEEHNALSAHLERQRLARDGESDDTEEEVH